MPKRILILVLCIAFKIGLVAQESFEPSTHLGIHGGVNFSAVSFRPSTSIKQNFVLSDGFGIVFRHVSEPHIGIQIEVNVAGKGWQEVIDSVGKYTRRLETIDLPILAVFIAGNRTVRFAFTIGPYVSYLRNEKEIIGFSDQTKYRPYYNKPIDHQWEFGFTGGVGVEFHTRLGAFALHANYSHALNNLFPLNRDVFYYNSSRNQVIHAGLMYMYTF